MKSVNRIVRRIRSKKRARKLIKRGEHLEVWSNVGNPGRISWCWYVYSTGMRNPHHITE